MCGFFAFVAVAGCGGGAEVDDTCWCAWFKVTARAWEEEFSVLLCLAFRHQCDEKLGTFFLYFMQELLAKTSLLLFKLALFYSI